MIPSSPPSATLGQLSKSWCSTGVRVGMSLVIDPPVIQAPMSAVTNLAMRTLAEEQGCGLTITEFLPADGIAARVPSVLNKLTPSLDGRLFGVQIYGRKPEAIARAAAIAAATGAALVDINMGCPGKRVRAGSCGAALMREPTLAQEIVRAAIEGVSGSAEVTVKMRAGWDDGHKNAPELAARLAERGAKMITVHGRTRQQRYSGQVDHEIIRQVKLAVTRAPVIANGDITDGDSMERMLEYTGADGVMVGRAAIGNPWIFSDLNARLCGIDAAHRVPSTADRLSMYLRHLSIYTHCIDESHAVIEMRKFAEPYLGRIPQGKELCRAIYSLDRASAVHALLDDYQMAHDHFK